MNLGIEKINISDKLEKDSFLSYVIYPATDPLATNKSCTKFGVFSINAMQDAKISKGKFPIAIISHGSGGNPLTYLSTAEFLAKKGFVVVLVEHYKNNRNNNELEGKTKNFETRPRHISLAIDKVLLDSKFSNYVFESVILIGHSMGGYTAMALAGGIAYTKERKKITTKKDKRIKAIVLLAPATGFFKSENSLQYIDIPVLFFSGEKDNITTTKEHKDLLENQFFDHKNIFFEVVKNAGHFSFLPTFPKAMISPKFLPSTDPKGFDRCEFHQKLNNEIIDFANKFLIKE
jgi:predicted dienelactone hydrolase